MSSESAEFDISSTKDIEITEFSGSSDGNSDSGSSSYLTASSKWSTIQSETDEAKDNDVANTFLNSSDENPHEFDIEQAPLSSLKGISTGDLTSSRKSSSDREASVLTRKASSLEGPLIRRVSSLDHLEEPSTRRVTSLDPLEGPLTRRVSSLNSLKGPSTKRISSADSSEEPSTRRVSSLDPFEGPSPTRVSSLNALEGYTTRRVSSLDPLEGPSTRTVWFSDAVESSLTSIYTSHDSETETNDEAPTQQNGSWFRSFLRRYSRQIRHSRYYPLFYVALLVIPCSAGYMGSKYQGLCRGCPQLPILVYILGILGMWIITIRITAILSKRYFAPPLTGHEFDSWMVSILLIFVMCLLIEMVTTFICEPIFIHPPREEFCIKVFYNYAYCLNVILPLVILLLLLIYIPSCFDPAEDE